MRTLKTYIQNFFKGHERSVKAKKNIIASIGLKSISILIGIIYVPLLLDYLDAERYGIWLTISSVLLWFGYFDIGLGNGLRNKLTETFAIGDYTLAKKYVSTAYAIIIIIFISVLFVFLIINYFLNWQTILNTSTISKNELSKLTNIVFSFFILKFILQIIGKIYMADQKPAMNSLFGPLANIIAVFVIILLKKYTPEGNLIALGFVLSASPVLILIIVSFFTFKNSYKNIAPSIKWIDFKLRRDILGLGFRFFILQLSSIMLFSTSNIIITQMFSPDEVTKYNIVFRYFQIPIMLYAIINTPIWSAVTDAYIKKDFNWLEKTLRKMNKISILFAIGIIMMVLFQPWVFKLWLGDRIEIPTTLVLGMSLFALISVIISPYSSYINGFGKLQLSNYLVGFTFIVFLPLAIYMSKLMHSSVGVILAISVVNAVGLISLPLQVSRILKGNDYGIWGK